MNKTLPLCDSNACPVNLTRPLLTKRVKCEKDFRFANGVLSGAQPELYESAAVLKILSKP